MLCPGQLNTTVTLGRNCLPQVELEEDAETLDSDSIEDGGLGLGSDLNRTFDLGREIYLKTFIKKL